MKPEVEDKVLWTFSSFAPNRQTSLQSRITKKIEDLQRFLCINAGARYYQEGANR